MSNKDQTILCLCPPVDSCYDVDTCFTCALQNTLSAVGGSNTEMKLSLCSVWHLVTAVFTALNDYQHSQCIYLRCITEAYSRKQKCNCMSAYKDVYWHSITECCTASKKKHCNTDKIQHWVMTRVQLLLYIVMENS